MLSLNVRVQVCKIHVLNLFQLLLSSVRVLLVHVVLTICQTEALIEMRSPLL